MIPELIMMKKLAITCLMFCFLPVNLAIAANNHEHHENEVKTIPAQYVNTENVLLPSISVKFELQTSTQNVDWFMDRKLNSIATFNGASQQGEMWSRNPNGDIEHSRIFLQDKKLVEYTNGELKTQNKLPQWNRLASIFDPKQIEKLNKTGEKVLFGKQAFVLEGALNGVPTIVWWMPEIQIPAYVQQGEGNMSSSLVMKEILTQTPSTWEWANPSMLETYTRLDASDLGDMEGDPFVKKLLELDGHHHH